MVLAHIRLQWSASLFGRNARSAGQVKIGLHGRPVDNLPSSNARGYGFLCVVATGRDHAGVYDRTAGGPEPEAPHDAADVVSGKETTKVDDKGLDRKPRPS